MAHGVDEEDNSRHHVHGLILWPFSAPSRQRENFYHVYVHWENSIRVRATRFKATNTEKGLVYSMTVVNCVGADGVEVYVNII